MGIEAAAALAKLGRVDYRAVGLDDFGKPDGFLDRQVSRWMGELDSYGRYEGYPGPDIPGLHETAQWLDANKPKTFTPGILHGDYHLANVMYALDGPQMAAIVDWEMCTIGDPLLDLGWLVATWPDPEHPGPAVAPGSPCSYAPAAGMFPTPGNPLPCGNLDPNSGPFGQSGPYPGPTDVLISPPNPDGLPSTPGIPIAGRPGETPPVVPGTPVPMPDANPGARSEPMGPMPGPAPANPGAAPPPGPRAPGPPAPAGPGNQLPAPFIAPGEGGNSQPGGGGGSLEGR
jgi:hypothetical protein